MSQAIKKPNQNPESYSPKKPEILSMAETGALKTVIAYSANYVGGDIDSFETDRLIVRHFRNDDWQDLQQIAISNEQSLYSDYDELWPTDDAGIQGACSYFATKKQFWAAEVKELGKVVAFINFNGVNKTNEMDIGHVMNSTYFDNDYEYEALAVLYDYCFRNLEIDGICAGWCMSDKKKLEPLAKLGMALVNTGKLKPFHETVKNPEIETDGCRPVINRDIWEKVNPTEYKQ